MDTRIWCCEYTFGYKLKLIEYKKNCAVWWAGPKKKKTAKKKCWSKTKKMIQKLEWDGITKITWLILEQDCKLIYSPTDDYDNNKLISY